MTGVPDLPADATSEMLADWAELSVALAVDAMSRGDMATIALRQGLDGGETTVAGAWAILEARQELYGGRAPLSITEDGYLASDPKQADLKKWHGFLSWLAIGGEIDHEAREVFEECVAEIAGGLTGGPHLRLGAPRRTPVPKSLQEAIALYGEESVERTMLIEVPAPDDKDMGLDVVSWADFGDRRGASLHLIGQCASGAHWQEKVSQLSVAFWSDYVHWGVKPSRFFAIPFVVEDPHELHRLSRKAGLILDRPRLVGLASRQHISASVMARVGGILATVA